MERRVAVWAVLLLAVLLALWVVPELVATRDGLEGGERARPAATSDPRPRTVGAEVRTALPPIPPAPVSPADPPAPAPLSPAAESPPLHAWFRVVDAVTGAPVVGARLEVHQTAPAALDEVLADGCGWDEWIGRYLTYSDGRYPLSEDWRGIVATAVVPGRGCTGFVAIPPSGDLELRLGEGNVIEGTVREPVVGTPVAGVVVTLWLASDGQDGTAGAPTGVSGPDGRYRIAGILPGLPVRPVVLSDERFAGLDWNDRSLEVEGAVALAARIASGEIVRFAGLGESRTIDLEARRVPGVEWRLRVRYPPGGPTPLTLRLWHDSRIEGPDPEGRTYSEASGGDPLRITTWGGGRVRRLVVRQREVPLGDSGAYETTVFLPAGRNTVRVASESWGLVLPERVVARDEPPESIDATLVRRPRVLLRPVRPDGTPFVLTWMLEVAAGVMTCLGTAGIGSSASLVGPDAEGRYDISASIPPISPLDAAGDPDVAQRWLTVGARAVPERERRRIDFAELARLLATVDSAGALVLDVPIPDSPGNPR